MVGMKKIKKAAQRLRRKSNRARAASLLALSQPKVKVLLSPNISMMDQGGESPNESNTGNVGLDIAGTVEEAGPEGQFTQSVDHGGHAVGDASLTAVQDLTVPVVEHKGDDTSSTVDSTSRESRNENQFNLEGSSCAETVITVNEVTDDLITNESANSTDALQSPASLGEDAHMYEESPTPPPPLRLSPS